MNRAGDRYDAIGRGYAAYRVADPRLERALTDALGDARTVLNVGAGTGAYEPTGPAVVAVEPSRLMAAQRPPRPARYWRPPSDFRSPIRPSTPRWPS